MSYEGCLSIASTDCNSVGFCALCRPPISQIMEHNNGLVNELDGLYNSNISSTSTLAIVLGSYNNNLNISASFDILTPSLLVDNMTSAHNGLRILFARGIDYQLFESGDLDGDGCTESPDSIFVQYDLDAVFDFKNASVAVPIMSTYVEVPSEILVSMADSSGNDELNITVHGNVIFTAVLHNSTT